MINTGIVAWFNTAKGYGEITSAEDKEPIFFTHLDLKKKGIFKNIKKGQKVTFTTKNRVTFGLKHAESVREAR